MTEKKTLLLEGLNCAGCGAKIEDEVNRIEGVKASLNFVRKTLMVETDMDFSILMPKLKDIVKIYEPGAAISEFKTEKEPFAQGNKRIRLLAAGLFLFAAALLSKPSAVIKPALYLASYMVLGAGVFVKAWKGILKGNVFTENFLMSVATIGALSIGEFTEGVAVMLFYQVGELLQDMALDRSRKSISRLMDLSPDYGNVLRNGTVQKVSPKDILIGESILVKPGEKIPLDGIISDGTSHIDKSALTGESLPFAAGPGDEVFSGSVNMDGLLTIKVTKSFENSTAEKILEMVENAAAKKAPAEKFITRFAKVYTPSVVLIAFLLALVPPVIIALTRNNLFQASGYSAAWEGALAEFKELFSVWLYRALTFLVISCPCALVISVPLGYFGGLGLASGNGVLIKGGNYLDALNHLETAVFDKTGTLTKGIFEVADVVPKGKYSRQMLLQIAAEAESFSNHPIAKSIRSAAGKTPGFQEGIKHVELPGLGVEYYRNGEKILIGNKRLMEEEKIIVPEMDAMGVIVHIAVDGIYEGYLVISDSMKDDSAQTVNILKEMGIKTVMLTGDLSNSANTAAKLTGIDIVYPELLPNEKVEIFENIKKDSAGKGNIMFIGDGINDAPVLARADVGVAMGGLGSDAAVEAADIVLMSDEPSKIITAIKIAKKTRTVVWQNIFLAFAVKALVLIMGAGGMASMWEAVFADVGVALAAIANAMRLIHNKTK